MGLAFLHAKLIETSEVANWLEVDYDDYDPDLGFLDDLAYRKVVYFTRTANT